MLTWTIAIRYDGGGNNSRIPKWYLLCALSITYPIRCEYEIECSITFKLYIIKNTIVILRTTVTMQHGTAFWGAYHADDALAFVHDTSITAQDA